GFDTRDEAVSWCVDSAQTSLKFWDTLVDHKQRGDRDTEGHQVIRCRNSHYIVYPPQTDVSSELAGYGGREWEFKMLADGRLIRSRNVWTQGMIPIDYRSKLPDNAVQLHQEDRLARYDPNSTPVG
ncbi:MAG TPA: hypothetical protein VHV10_07705, partial [Ktedonobacteraceae bacterium]|nr:hypothetical protein [Ktedonobacteraceae bacterium]